jgi:hypothetical protein
MLQFFEFEAEFVDSLRCIPMQVRYKLDTCGIKLKLQHWHSFSSSQRQSLIDLPCETADEIKIYRENLRSQVFQNLHTYPNDLPIDANPAWLQDESIPVSVLEQVQKLEIAIAPLQLQEKLQEEWQKLTSLQRFALIKLSKSDHENNNFLPALQEFGIVT